MTFEQSKRADEVHIETVGGASRAAQRAVLRRVADMATKEEGVCRACAMRLAGHRWIKPFGGWDETAVDMDEKTARKAVRALESQGHFEQVRVTSKGYAILLSEEIRSGRDARTPDAAPPGQTPDHPGNDVSPARASRPAQPGETPDSKTNTRPKKTNTTPSDWVPAADASSFDGDLESAKRALSEAGVNDMEKHALESGSERNVQWAIETAQQRAANGAIQNPPGLIVRILQSGDTPPEDWTPAAARLKAASDEDAHHRAILAAATDEELLEAWQWNDRTWKYLRNDDPRGVPTRAHAVKRLAVVRGHVQGESS